ncbi:hypothetical protein MAR_020761, partial [Mya arenaria]
MSKSAYTGQSLPGSDLPSDCPLANLKATWIQPSAQLHFVWQWNVRGFYCPRERIPAIDVFHVCRCSVADIITAVGYGSSGCGTDPIPPSYLICSCVSRRQYACVIQNVTRDMNEN